jgi:hypothetical protein
MYEYKKMFDGLFPRDPRFEALMECIIKYHKTVTDANAVEQSRKLHHFAKANGFSQKELSEAKRTYWSNK